MKIDVYDYRTMSGGRAARFVHDVPEDLEDRLKVWDKNGWVIGIIPGDGGPPDRIAAMDFLTDIVMHSIPYEGMDAGVRALFAVDPPLLTQKLRASTEGRKGREEEA